MKNRVQGVACSAVILATLLQGYSSASAQGIPEPDLVLFGVIKNVQSNANLRLGYGTLQWIFQPAGGGQAITATTTLTNINNQFSYILRVPCETPVAGFTVSSNTIQLKSAGTTYQRSQVTWNGNPLAFVQPSQTNTAFGPTDRGRIERVDLDVSVPIVIDVNGLPVDWELSYFGVTGVDPYSDPDHDGMNNLAEYRAGTNPNDDASGLWITEIAQWTGGGTLVKWTSAPYKTYTVQRSSGLGAAFGDLITGIAADAPTNTFIDVSGGPSPRFYRIRLDDNWTGLTPFKLMSLQRDPLGGLRLEWTSPSNGLYAVQRSSNLSTGFTDIKLDLSPTPPVSSYLDSSATGFGPYFYRLRMQP